VLGGDHVRAGGERLVHAQPLAGEARAVQVDERPPGAAAADGHLRAGHVHHLGLHVRRLDRRRHRADSLRPALVLV